MTTKPTATAQEAPPVLAFPQAGLDDMATYRGYTTRFFKDSAGNTVQIYIKQNEGRVVNLWADAANESISFTAHDAADKPAVLTWESATAKLSAAGEMRFVEYSLISKTPRLELGHFVLNTMRLERDFQYFKKHLEPVAAEPFIPQELVELIENLERLPKDVRARQLRLLNAETLDELRSRQVPKIERQSRSGCLIAQPTFDGKNHLSLELEVDSNQAEMAVSERKIAIRALRDEPIRFTIKIGTDSPSLTPLQSKDIFNSDFFEFYERAKSARLERQVKSMKLLSSHEKLMAGLPNYATYFGRDMMMSALMLEPVLRPEMLEHVVASVLKKLTPDGEVSHEEGLGGQAIRENAAKYNRLLAAYFAEDAESDKVAALAAAEKVLEDLQAVTENYHMVDDDFQLPVLAARYLTNPEISDERKRAFLHSRIRPGDPTTRLMLLLRNFVYVAKVSRAYAENPVPENLVSFRKLDGQRWHAGSWRDSAVGYAGGRYAMDINAIWVPMALESVEKILATFRRYGIALTDVKATVSGLGQSKLLEYAQEPDALRKAIQTWEGAFRHFEVRLTASEVERRVAAKLHWLPAAEQTYWRGVLTQSGADKKGVQFLAISLDEAGRPIPVAHTDIATWLFLNKLTEKIVGGELQPETVLQRLQMFVTPYPVGLFLEGVGPVVANDVYAETEVWENFKHDLYHSPRVIWGREVNLLFLGLTRQILAAHDSEGRLRDARLNSYVQELRAILDKTVSAVAASGLKNNELWSYRIEDGKLLPARYATSTDIQLWNLTDLAVQFLLKQISN